MLAYLATIAMQTTLRWQKRLSCRVSCTRGCRALAYLALARFSCYIFVYNDLDLWPIDLKCAHPVTQRSCC